MNNQPTQQGWLLGLVGLGVGLIIGYIAVERPVPNPQARAIDANTWMQTSSEFRALCLQTFRLAGERLEQQVKQIKQKPVEKPLAIVTDLDETIFDNSAFQTWLYRNRLDYSDALWQRWEKDYPEEVRLVPGAKDFIDKAEKDGVVVVYISNRVEKYRDSTIKALEHNKLSTRKINDRLYLSTKTSDKTERRRLVNDKYTVLMYLGDNLRDFDEEFRAPKVNQNDVSALKKAIAERNAKVDGQREKFGAEWFVLPNPAYGEWMKLGGKQPAELWTPSGMPPR